ncbi:hypothetical protein KKC08_02465, partial [Patescibacteria group bacterium]|nr:hypothetical protein [Patescibacteria group bacterium]
PLFLATLIVSVYYLAKYVQNKKILDLVLTGTFVMMTTLVRYDGWFLFVYLLALLPVWGYFTLGKKRTEGIFFLFASIGGFGILLWLLWNWAIFSDPIYFMTGPYSAHAQQEVLQSVGQLPTKGNLFTASSYFVWSIIANNGIVLTLTGGIGILATLLILKKKKQILSLLAISSPLLFNILALYMGHSAMNVPQATLNPGYFNIRYGLLVLPVIAFVVGILASVKPFGWIMFGLITIQTLLFIPQGKPVVLIDGLRGLKNTYHTVEASQWLAENYQKGLILTSLASHDAFVARTGLPMKLYIHEGTREHWQEALKMPSKKVSYIALISYPPDVVYKALENNSDFKKNYKLVHSYGTFEIYELQNEKNN